MFSPTYIRSLLKNIHSGGLVKIFVFRWFWWACQLQLHFDNYSKDVSSREFNIQSVREKLTRITAKSEETNRKRENRQQGERIISLSSVIFMISLFLLLPLMDQNRFFFSFGFTIQIFWNYNQLCLLTIC